MSDRHEPTNRLMTARALGRNLINQLRRLTFHASEHDAPTVRVSFTTLIGDEHLGAVNLNAAMLNALRDSTASLADIVGYEYGIDHDDEPALDPTLIAEIEDWFDEIPADSYLADIVNSESPEAAQAAFEQMVTGEWDGEL